MELPDSYKSALIALKDQATAVTGMLPGESKESAAQAQILLDDAQRRMAEFKAETGHIVRLLMKSKDHDLTIPTMTEDDLERLLEGS
jgi:hypothetical protein